MIIRPAVIALLAGSGIVSFMLLYSAFYGLRIVRTWNMASGSEHQLAMERKTYLLSTIMAYVLSFQLLSFFLFIFTVDDMHALFFGAMCAAGTLNVNSYGYPAILLKVLNFVIAGVWLILNYADNRAVDYPLIRKKYLLLLVLTPLVLLETIVQGAYFIGLRADVITSCCGSLFNPEAESVTADIAALPRRQMQFAFFASAALAVACGIYCMLKTRVSWSWYLFSFLNTVSSVVSFLSLVSFISLYFYELPTHHCPFCILQKEYWYSGYVLYLALLGGATAGLGVGALTPFRNVGSLSSVIPAVQNRLVFVAVACSIIFTSTSAVQMVISHLILE